MRTIILLIAALGLPPAFGSDALVQIDTRAGATVPIYYMKRPNAVATVILLPGGSGGIGKVVNGKPTGNNFVVRSRDYFAGAGLNVAVMGRPSDNDTLDYADRIASWHIEDIRNVVDYLKKDGKLPVWLVGTSRGTISATAAAIALGADSLAGIVLTSSVVSGKKTGAVPKQNLGAIRIPVLVVHHDNDACKVCAPEEVPKIIKGLRNAVVKKHVGVRGGENPSGDPCGALHYHGFIGVEKAVVEQITAWIRSPSP